MHCAGIRISGVNRGKRSRVLLVLHQGKISICLEMMHRMQYTANIKQQHTSMITHDHFQATRCILKNVMLS